MRGHHHFPQTRIVKSDGNGWGNVQFMQCHAVAPDGSPALHDHQRAPRQFTIIFVQERTSFQVYYKTNQGPVHPPSDGGISPFVDNVCDV